MKLYLGSHLSWYAPGKQAELEIPLAAPALLSAILAQLGVPLAEVAIAAVNGNLVSLRDARVAESDRVELFPANGGG